MQKILKNILANTMANQWTCRSIFGDEDGEDLSKNNNPSQPL